MENPIESLVFGGLEPKLKPTAPQNFCHPLDCDHPQEISLWKDLLQKKIQQKKKQTEGRMFSVVWPQKIQINGIFHGILCDLMGINTLFHGIYWEIPSGKLLHNELERSTSFQLGKSTALMAMFNSKQ
jgi:hypothetical protein